MSEDINPQPVATLHEVTPVSVSFAEDQRHFGNATIFRCTPDAVRSDETTGEPARPLVYVQGVNGDGGKLGLMMRYLATRDQREVLAVSYTDKLVGSPKPVKEGKYHRSDASIPGIDAVRADDLAEALKVSSIQGSVDVVAESGGAVRALLLADNPQVDVRNLLLVDPAGLDGRSPVETHLDALRLLAGEKLGQTAVDMVGTVDSHEGRLRRQRRLRPEQKAVAYADTTAILAEVAEHTNVRITSDRRDKAFRTHRIADAIVGTRAELVETDKGGHGVGLNRAALDMVVTNLHEMERTAPMAELQAQAA